MTEKAIRHKNSGKYVVLFISCPACGKGNATKWYHADNNCYKYTEINEYGYVRCTSAHGAAFFDWRWDCGRHNGIFKQANQEYLASAFMHLIKDMVNKDFPWYSKLVMNVNEQFEGH
eukprot:UN01912